MVMPLLLIQNGCVRAERAPPDYGYSVPSPEPALPAEMDSFAPPLLGDSRGAGIAEFTRSAKPNDIVTLAGPDFTTATQFRFYGQTTKGDSVIVERGSTAANQTAASVILPSQLPAWSTYLVWPRNGTTFGKPVAINRTDAWWIGCDRAATGDIVSVYGRNLAHANGTSASYIYIKAPGNAAGAWVTPTSVNPYKVDFRVPRLAAGPVEVWAHNGHGGRLGWSGPLTLTVLAASPFAKQSGNVFDVHSYGATGNGSADDTDAVSRALEAAANAAPATLYFPAGTYVINRCLALRGSVSWVGATKDTTIIEPGLTFNSDNSNRPLLFSAPGNAAADNVEFKNLTITWNPSNVHSAKYASLLLKLTGQDTIKITDARLNWKGVLGGVSLAGTTHLDTSGTEFIGDGLFLGGSSQVSIRHSNFRLTDYATSAITSWGGNEIAVSGNKAQDYDPSATTSAGVGSGRFFTAQSHPNSNRNMYIGNNTTVAMSPGKGLGDANQGEQILFETGTSTDVRSPSSATATSATFSSPPKTSTTDGPFASQEAYVIKGKGAGQTRHVAAVTGNTVTVTPPWSIIPNGSSLIGMGGGQTNSVVYHNTLDGKANYASYETASVGVSMYGNVSNTIFANNTLTRIRNGLAHEASEVPNATAPTPSALFFNLITNNTLNGAWFGMVISTNNLTENKPGLLGHIGNSYRANTLTNVAASGIQLRSDWQGFTGGDVDHDVFEHNTITNVPVAFSVARGYSFSKAAVHTRFRNIHLYANSFTRRTATASGSKALDILGSTTSFWRSANVWNGFGTSGMDKDVVPASIRIKAPTPIPPPTAIPSQPRHH